MVIPFHFTQSTKTTMKTNAPKGSLPPACSTSAIVEMTAAADERAHGPKHHAKCPDCGATLIVRKLENGRYELDFVRHDN